MNRNTLIALFFLIPFFVFAQTNVKGPKISTTKTSLPATTKAIIVGISDYVNIRSLNFAHSDALTFYNFLTSPAGGNVDSNNIVLLINEDATSANIYSSLDWLVDEAESGERIIVYFSGHGDLETKTMRQNGFLLGYDAPDHCYMAGGTVSVRFLQDYLETIAQQNGAEILLITDACRSGKLAGGQEGAQNTSAALAQNWQSITKVLSSQAGEYSLEAKDWGNGAGVFTHYLVQGLTGKADRNKDKEVSTQELYMYLLENIGRETNYSQNPVLVGDMTSTLAQVDSLSFAQLNNKSIAGSYELLASKGLESMYKDQLDSITYEKYSQFRDCLENDNLIPEYSENENAWQIYEGLIDDDKAEVIHKHIARSLLAALQNESQVIVNVILSTHDENIDFSESRARLELSYVFNIIDSTYLLFDDIKARYLFLESVRDIPVEEQITLLEEASKLKPDAGYLYNRLGVRYHEINDYNNAIIAFNKAIEYVPTWHYPYYNLGGSYNQLRQFDTAIEYFDIAISLKPDEYPSYANKGYSLLGKGLTTGSLDLVDNARQLFNKAIDLGSNDPIVYNNLGLVNLVLKDYDKSIEYFEKYIELEPDDYSVYYKLGMVYSETEQYDKAIGLYKKSIENNPSDYKAYVFLGHNYYNQENYAYAIEAYFKVEEINPGLYTNYNDVAKCFRKLEKYDEALKYYNLAISINPENKYSYTGLGYTYSRIGKTDLAEVSFKKAIELDPDKGSVYYDLACYYALQNEIADALLRLEDALEKGYNSWDHIASDSDLQNIRNHNKFNELIEKYK